MYLLTITETISSAHCIPEHAGKCRHLHGHNYRVEAEFTAPDADALLAAKPQLAALVHEVADSYDHKYLNDLPPFQSAATTAESFSRILHHDLAPRCANLATVRRVTLWETAKYAASYSAE